MIRNKAVYIFHKVLDNKEFHVFRATALKYLAETLFLISGNKALAFKKFFYEIPNEL
jgi:hypothetical protein